MGEVLAELEAALGITSGQSARALAAKTEPSSGALARSLAFLQEDAPPGMPAQHRQPTVAERTQPGIARDHDTGSDILGKARGAVAKLRRRPLVLLGLAGGLVLLLGIVLTLTLRHGTLLVEIDEQLGKDVRVAVSQGGELIEVVDAKSGWTINLRSGRYEVAVRGGDDQLQLDSDSITVRRGERVKLKVTLKPKSPPLSAAVAPSDEKKAKEHQVGVVQARPKPKLEPEPKAETKLEAKPGPKAGPEVAEKPTEKSAVKPDANGSQEAETAARGKLPVPEEASLEKAAKLARDSFKDDYAKAKTAAQKLAIAENLRKTARQGIADPAERFVLLRLARDIAVQAGDATAAFATIDEMAQTFAVDPLAMKSEMLAAMADKARPDSRGELADAAIALIPRAMEAENFDVAKELAATAGSLAGKMRDRELTQRVRAVQKELAESVKAAEAVGAARGTLKDHPTDADANLVLGQYECFVRSRWNEGLKRLAAGADEELKALAQQDMDSRQANPDESVKLADAWWNLSRKAAGKNREGMALRAGAWYRQALDQGLPAGILRTRVEKRLAEIEKLGQGIHELTAGPPPARAPFDANHARLLQARWAKFLKVPVVLTNSIGMKLALIPPGEFEMGSPKDLIQEELNVPNDPDWLRDNIRAEGPRHHVRITHAFYLGVYPVTQAEYERVMGANPSCFSATGKQKGKVAGQDTKRLPVENVSWDDAAAFCERLSELAGEKSAKRRYALPTEAQWEYACRAGNLGPWCFSAQADSPVTFDGGGLLAEYGWFSENSGWMTHPVGRKRPNAWGLCDMYGNVWQWCQDWLSGDYYRQSPADDPSGPPSGWGRVRRGGCFTWGARGCRSAFRFAAERGQHDSDDQGFRVSLRLADK
jgi:formylglycine-generating enzyme required for sulfatase activity